MQSWIETELEFKNTCPDNMRRYINFLQSHHGYDNRKIAKHFDKYVNLIEYGVISTECAKILMRERI